ncbi:hypothetical protein Taro_040725 [Colocasia esculenta]|uniref:Uncharacterized protein n=1 Tax=Colocasia esculenta TaxID=4460 RepID=A0A843WDX5_COLES|nr:hypothetical protein [Colocasia esculenta]
MSSDLDTLTLVLELYVRMRERRQWDSDTLVLRSRQTVRARRTFLDRHLVRSRAVAVQGRYLQLCSGSSSSVV